MDNICKMVNPDSESESESDVSYTEPGIAENPVSDLFPPTDIILEVEGIDIHVNKQVLMDNSDVFKAMFESEFREKHEEKIPLPRKNYDDFVEFLSTFYPPTCAPITEETILKVAPLADEYEVDSVQRQCESFLREVCQKACDDKCNTIQVSVLVNYVACAEKYRMTSVLPLAIHLCAERSTRLLRKAGLHTKISEETANQIFDSREKMTEEGVKSCLLKGIGLQSSIKKTAEKHGVEPGSYLADMCPFLSKWILCSKSENTIKSCFNAFKRWEVFITTQGHSALPASPIHVALYLTHLLQSGASQHSVNNAVYAITWAHDCAGLIDPTKN